jgi:hypothetical protein
MLIKKKEYKLRVAIFFLAFVSWLLAAPITVFADEAAEDEFSYTVNADGNTVTLTGYNGAGGDVTIPSEIDGKAVTSIGKMCFQGHTGVTSVVISEGITFIDNRAFYDCTNLTSITIPDSVTSIKEYVFYGCSSLSSITIPDSVTSVGGGCFGFCSQLTSVKLPEGITSLGGSFFNSCYRLKSITIPNSVTYIGMSCFAQSGLEYVTIPSKVSSIRSGVFSNCLYLKNVVYPENCNVSEAEIGEGVTKVTYKVEDDKVTITGIMPGNRGYEFVQPAEISGYTDIEVPAEYQQYVHTTHSISPATCTKSAYCTVCRAEFGEPLGHSPSADYVHDDTNHWKTCANDETEQLDKEPHDISPATCTESAYCTICKAEFGEPLGHNITPATCTESAFCTTCGEKFGEPLGHKPSAEYTHDDTNHWKTCANDETEQLDKAAHTFNSGVVTVQPTVTQKGTKTYTCTVCGAVKTEDIDALGLPAKGSTVTVSGALYVVTNSAASNGTVQYKKPVSGGVTSVTIPEVVTVNGVSYKVTSVASNAFKNNKKLTKVIIGKNVKTVGTSAFSGCSKLKTVSMGANVTTINAKAFYKCIALTKITIPAKVNKIGKQAFYGCKNLKTVTIKTKKLTSKNVGSKAFKGIHSKAAIKVPKSKLASYKKILKAKGIGSKVKVKK